MLSNYLTVALRNILKHKFFAAINVIGLVIGMACCLLIFVYVKDELSYDRFHKDAVNIYRVGLHGRIAGQEIYTANTSLPVGPAMQSDIPGVEEILRVVPASRSSGMTFRYEDKVFAEKNLFYSDSNFFTFFSFDFLAGNPATALKESNSIVLTDVLAKKYFGEEDPIGKIILVGNDKRAYSVTGITKEAPSNSHLRFNAIISFISVEKDYFQGWTGNSIYTYARKNSNTDPKNIDAGLEELVDVHVGKELEEGMGINFDEFRKQGGIYSYIVFPITDTHLRSLYVDDIEPPSDIKYVYIFSAVGIFILLIACINFMNLSTARSAGRAKEVGLRKTLGSQRSQMIFQFLAESFMYSLVAIVLAVGISYLVLPQFNLLSGKQLTLEVLWHPTFILTALVLVVFVGLIAGSYPAFYLTSFSAVDVLKGKIRSGMKSKGVRSTLVVLQFAVSTFLILATIVVYQQLSFMQDKNLGIDQHNIINVQNMRRLGSSREAFKNKIESSPSVLKSSFTNNAFPGVDNTTVFRVIGRDIDYLSGKYYADWDHIDVLKLHILEGRFFSRDFATDSSAVIINEAAVKEFLLDDPLHSRMLDYNGEVPDTVRVIGIVKDFNFESVKLKVRPMVIRLQDVSRNLLVRYSGNPQEIISTIENLWKETAPGEPLEYSFIDQDFDALFRAEMRLRNIFTVLSSLTIIIACLGLFALVAFTTEQRTKEIGIRKAMGASKGNLILLLSNEFTRLVMIAIVPALAGGYFVADWWLADFSYRMDMSPIIFIVSGLAAISIAWFTVLYQALKAAKSNPVDSLRYE